MMIISKQRSDKLVLNFKSSDCEIKIDISQFGKAVENLQEMADKIKSVVQESQLS